MRYNPKVMEYFRKTKNYGKMENPDAVGKVGNSTCGDEMWIYLKIKDDTIVDAKFETFGCVAAIATSSMAVEMIKGIKIGEANTITNKVVTEKLGGLPKEKLHCSVLAEEGIQAAIEDYKEKHI